MAKLSKESKQRLQQLFQCGQFVVRWGFIPTVLYLERKADFVLYRVSNEEQIQECLNQTS